MAPRGLTYRRAQDLRRTLTPPEVALWQALRARKLAGLRFRRQHPVGPWIVDFYCAERRLAVEVDGEVHGMGDLDRDARRDADLTRRGVRVMRFAARDVLHEIDGVVAMIASEAGV